MSDDTPKSRAELRRMFWHDFAGTIADNMVEVNWILVITLAPALLGAPRDAITTMFGLTDVLWVVFSCIYYSARTAMNSMLPAHMVGKGAEAAGKPLKNALYLSMGILAIPMLVCFIFTGELMTMLGAPAEHLPMYVNYFRLCLVSIFWVCPAALLIPAHLRATFQNKTAMMLDHVVTWSMALGCWLTVHVLHHGVLSMMVVNILSNAAPLIWFLWKRPIPGFFRRLELDLSMIKALLQTAKWEIVRRLTPRLASVFTTSSLLVLEPALLTAKYVIDTLAMFIYGFLEAAAGLSVIEASHNLGLGYERENCHSNHGYILSLATWPILGMSLLLWLTSGLWGQLFSSSPIVLAALANPLVWAALGLTVVVRSRYYVLLSLTRVLYKQYNGFPNTSFAVITAVVTPLATVVFLNWLGWGLLAVYAVGLVVAGLQTWVFEAYLHRRKITL